MNANWKKAKDKVASISQREKILLLLMGMILIPGIIDFFLLQPLRDEAIQWRNKTESINQQMSSLSTQQQELLVEIENDPAMELERRIEGVSKALNVSKQALIRYTDTLIPPQKMALMLESMLHETDGLKLHYLENMPVSSLFQKPNNGPNDKPTDSDGSAMNEPQTTDVFGLYRHGIKLVFKGNYMDTLTYLNKLEQLSWKFYWQNFDYQVEKHPKALISLQIYTLSTSEWWIGDEGE